MREYKETLKDTLLTNEDISLYIQEACKGDDLEVLQLALRDCLMTIEYRINSQL